jgi:hypothetical protein
MALDPQPLADAARGPAGVSTRALAAGLLLVGGVAAAPALDAGTEAYRKAAATGALGAVTGRAWEERRTPDAAEQPLAGTVVTLLPRSRALRARLEEIKTRARDSQSAYVASATAIRRAREAYERQLWEAGATDLVRTTVVDGAGAFALGDLPAGEWMLIASHSVFVSRASPRPTKRERDAYLPRLRLIGYNAVSVWLRELTIVAGQAQVVELSDRSVWFTGIEEERMLDADP